METMNNRVVTIGEFEFRQDLFFDLSQLFSSGSFRNLIDPVGGYRGVYYFFENSGVFSYVGYTRTRIIKERLKQYRTRSKTGNSFWEAYRVKHDNSLFDDHFQPYVKGLHLGTISIDGENLSEEQKTKLKKVLKGIEDALICKYKPTYNRSYYRVTDSECRQLSREWLRVSTPGGCAGRMRQ